MMGGLPKEIVGEDTDLFSILFHFPFKAMGKTSAAFFEGLAVWGGVDAFRNSTGFVSQWHAS